MSQIRYESRIVTDEILKSHQATYEEARGAQRYPRWQAFNHYRRLQRHQDERYHYRYMTSGNEETHCTCGLSVQNSLLKTIEVQQGLEPIQLISGHVRMPEDDGFTAAFITGFTWHEAERIRTWQVFCQRCRLYLEELTFNDATEWVLEHEGHLS